MSQPPVPCLLSPKGFLPSSQHIAWHKTLQAHLLPLQAKGSCCSSLQPKDRQQEHRKREGALYWMHKLSNSLGAKIQEGGKKNCCHRCGRWGKHHCKSMALLSICCREWEPRCFSFILTAAVMRPHLSTALCFRCAWLRHSISTAAMSISCLPATPFYKHSATSQLSLLSSMIQPLPLSTALHLQTLCAALPVILC